MLSLMLAFAPRYTALGPMAPNQIWTPLPSKAVSVGDLQIATMDTGPRGEGTPLVFVHGLSSYGSYWEHQIEAFPDRRVLALDLPGFGASSRPDAPYTPPWFAEMLVDWMDAMGLEKVVLAGHSMGAQACVTLALDHPERVEGLVLSAPAGFETFDAGAASWMKAWWTETRAMDSSEAELRAVFSGSVFNVTDEGVERLLKERVALGQHPSFRGTSVAVSRSIHGMLDHPVVHRLDALSMPVLVVFGTDDRMIPNPVFTGGRTRRIAEAGARSIPDARLVMVPRAGHTVHHDAPGPFNDAVDAFLGEL